MFRLIWRRRSAAHSAWASLRRRLRSFSATGMRSCLAVIAGIGGTLEKFATEIRHLQRTEVGEVEEPFDPGNQGSSAMPHKRNPHASERISGLARLLRGYATTAAENNALWHERDISHSSTERVIMPDACHRPRFHAP